jgi:hypothetical protein
MLKRRQMTIANRRARRSMKRRTAMVGIILTALGLSGCKGSNSWHQKLTVTVSTPTGEVSGSSVSKVGISFAEDAWLAPGYAYSAEQTGEAVVVEVSRGKFLFALLTIAVICLVSILPLLARGVTVNPATPDYKILLSAIARIA